MKRTTLLLLCLSLGMLTLFGQRSPAGSLLPFTEEESYGAQLSASAIADWQSPVRKQALSIPANTDSVVMHMFKMMDALKVHAAGSKSDRFGLMSINLRWDLMVDDMAMLKGGYGWFYTGVYDYCIPALNKSSRAELLWMWEYLYALVNQSNALLSVLSDLPATTEMIECRANALAVRGLAYFYLAQSFLPRYAQNRNKPGIPLILQSIDRNGYFEAGRSTVGEVYDQIQADWEKALDVAPMNSGKTYFSKDVVRSLLSRLFLAKEEWNQVIAHAQKVIEGGNYALVAATPGFNSLNPTNVIWGTRYNDNYVNTFFAHLDDNYPGYAQGSPKYITKELYDRIPMSDRRKGWFAEDRRQNKFRAAGSDFNADNIFLRLEEVYLNLAEAQVETGELTGATASLNQILLVNDNPPLNAGMMTAEALREEIKLQRRIELWGEGLRRFDMLRRNEGVVRSVENGHSKVFQVTPGSWQLIYPIPIDEFYHNTALQWNKDQNTGYLDDTTPPVLEMQFQTMPYQILGRFKVAVPAYMGTNLQGRFSYYPKGKPAEKKMMEMSFTPQDLLSGGTIYSYKEFDINELPASTTFVYEAELLVGGAVAGTYTGEVATAAALTVSQLRFSAFEIGMQASARLMDGVKITRAGFQIADTSTVNGVRVPRDSVFVQYPDASGIFNAKFRWLVPDKEYRIRAFIQVNGMRIESDWIEAYTAPHDREYIYPLEMSVREGNAQGQLEPETDRFVRKAALGINNRLFIKDYPEPGNNLMIEEAERVLENVPLQTVLPDNYDRLVMGRGQKKLFNGNNKLYFYSDGILSGVAMVDYKQADNAHGDVNNDGKIDAADLAGMIEESLKPGEMDPEVVNKGDYNQDGIITVDDIVAMAFDVNNVTIPDATGVETGVSKLGIDDTYQVKISTSVPLAGFDIVVYGWQDAYKDFIQEIPGFTLRIYQKGEETHILAYSESMKVIPIGTHVLADLSPLFAQAAPTTRAVSLFDNFFDINKSIFIDSYNRRSMPSALTALTDMESQSVRIIMENGALIVSGSEALQELTLYNASGLAVKRTAEKRIALNGLEQGVYVLRVKTGTDLFCRKIVIRKD